VLEVNSKIYKIKLNIWWFKNHFSRGWQRQQCVRAQSQSFVPH
jgi:hypothetical protein